MMKDLNQSPDYMELLERASQQFLTGAGGGNSPQAGNGVAQGSPSAILAVHQAYMQFQGTAQSLISKAQHDIERRDDKLAALGEKYEEQVKAVEKLGTQVEELTTKMKTAEEQHIVKLGQVETEKKTAADEAADTKTELETLKAQIATLQDEITALKAERDGLATEKTELEERVATLGASKVIPPDAKKEAGADTAKGEPQGKTAIKTAEELADEGSDSAERTRCVAVFKEYMLRRDEINATGGRHRLNEFHTWRGAHTADIEKGREYLRQSGEIPVQNSVQ